MKLGKKEISLLIGLMGVLIAVVAWFFVASPMKDKTAAIEAENVELKAKSDEYQAVNAQRPQFEADTLTLQAERSTLLAHFPSGMTKEDEIMYWANMERANSSTMAMGNLVMSNWSEVFVDGQPESNDEGATQLHLYRVPVNYSYQATYEGIKNLVTYVFSKNDKMSIENITASYDNTTGNLVGTVDINMYYMSGTGNDYVPATIPTVPTGIVDIFQSESTLTDAADVSSFAAEDESSEE